MCYDLVGTFCVEEEVFLLLYMEGSFVLLRTGDMAMVVDICSHVTTRHGNCLQHRDTFYNLERCFVVDIGIYCNEMFVGDAARVQLAST